MLQFSLFGQSPIRNCALVNRNTIRCNTQKVYLSFNFSHVQKVSICHLDVVVNTCSVYQIKQSIIACGYMSTGDSYNYAYLDEDIIQRGTTSTLWTASSFCNFVISQQFMVILNNGILGISIRKPTYLQSFCYSVVKVECVDDQIAYL